MMVDEDREGVMDKILELFQSNDASIAYGEDPDGWVESNLPEGAEAADVASCMPEVAGRLGGPYEANVASYNATHGAHGHAATGTVVNELSYTYNTVYQQNAFIHAEPGAQVTNIQGNGNAVTQVDIDGEFEPEPPPLYGGDMIVVEGDMAYTREQFIEEYGEGALSLVDAEGNFEVPEGYTHIDGGLVDPAGHLLEADGTQGPPVYIAEADPEPDFGASDGGDPSTSGSIEPGPEQDPGADGQEGEEGEGGEAAEYDLTEPTAEYEQPVEESVPEPLEGSADSVAPAAAEAPEPDPMEGLDA